MILWKIYECGWHWEPCRNCHNVNMVPIVDATIIIWYDHGRTQHWLTYNLIQMLMTNLNQRIISTVSCRLAPTYWLLWSHVCLFGSCHFVMWFSEGHITFSLVQNFFIFCTLCQVTWIKFVKKSMYIHFVCNGLFDHFKLTNILLVYTLKLLKKSLLSIWILQNLKKYTPQL